MPSPFTGGGGNITMKASWMLAKAWFSWPATAPPLWSARVRSANGLSMANTIPEFELLVNPLIDRPGNASVPSTLGFFSMMSPMRRITSSVRSSVAPSGSCAKPIRYCLSCAGTNPLGTALNTPNVAAASTTYMPSISALREITFATPPL